MVPINKNSINLNISSEFLFKNLKKLTLFISFGDQIQQ